jgi:hypothetical protein
MAQTKKKRSRKHRGTPAGTIDRAGRPGSGGKTKANAKAKADPKQAARERRMERINRPPTWRGAVNRAAIAAAVFGVLVVAAFGRPVIQGALLAAFMFVLYIPLGYLTDKAVFNFRNRRKR